MGVNVHTVRVTGADVKVTGASVNVFQEMSLYKITITGGDLRVCERNSKHIYCVLHTFDGWNDDMDE